MRRVSSRQGSRFAPMLEQELAGKTFLDVGSRSGLFSLAARRMGAHVRSFDVNQESVACAIQLRRQYCADDRQWIIERGSILDKAYLDSLPTFDIVLSWGVLHHTGDMAKALDHVANLVAPNGTLFIAIYNDQGRASRRWLAVKRTYNLLPSYLRFLVLVPAFLRLWGPTTLCDWLSGEPFRTWKNYQRERGMSPWRDVVDWVGGYPFEVAKPEQIFEIFQGKGLFTLKKLKTCAGGLGCNEFVFVKSAERST